MAEPRNSPIVSSMTSTADRPPDPALAPTPAPRVRALEPLDRRGRRVRVLLDARGEDDGENDVLELALEVVERVGLGAGDPVDEALRARDAALAYLAHRPRSRAEMRRRLRARSFPAAVVEGCLDELTAKGLLDDAAFAEVLVRERLRRNPRGAARLRDELCRRGLDPAAATAAVERGLGAAGTADEALAVAAALRWLKRSGEDVRRALAGEAPEGSRYARRFGAPSPRAAAIRRLTVFLRGRGFGGEAVRAAVAAAEHAARVPRE